MGLRFLSFLLKKEFPPIYLLVSPTHPRFPTTGHVMNSIKCVSRTPSIPGEGIQFGDKRNTDIRADGASMQMRGRN